MVVNELLNIPGIIEIFQHTIHCIVFNAHRNVLQSNSN